MRTMIILLSICLSTSASADMYKCVDPATGQTTFSQTRCAGAPARININVSRPSPESVAASAARQSAIDRSRRDAAEIQRRSRVETPPAAPSTNIYDSLSRSMEDSNRNIRQLRALQYR